MSHKTPQYWIKKSVIETVLSQSTVLCYYNTRNIDLSVDFEWKSIIAMKEVEREDGACFSQPVCNNLYDILIQ